MIDNNENKENPLQEQLPPWYEFSGEKGQQLLIIIISASGLFVLCFLIWLVFFIKTKRGKKTNKVVEEKDFFKDY